MLCSLNAEAIAQVKTRHFSKKDPFQGVVACACQNTDKGPTFPNQAKKGQDNV